MKWLVFCTFFVTKPDIFPGSVLAKYGKRVLVCEAHGTAGGAAHGFKCKLPKAGGAEGTGGGGHAYDGYSW